MTAEQPTDLVEPDEAASGPVHRPRLLWVAAAVLVALAVIGGVAWFLRPQPAPSSVPAATAQQAVTGFLEALAAGDADRALEYSLNRPTDTTLLTRSVLDASHEKSPVTVVNVAEVDGAGTVQVPAQVTFGEEPATITFSVTQTPSGWRLGQVTSTIDPGSLPASFMPTLNGQPLTNPSHLEVFPGVYTLGETVPEIRLEDSRVVVDAVGEDIRAGLQPVLSKAGIKAANTIAAAAVDDCMAEREPAPDGCPNRIKVESGQKVIAKTIRWNLVGNPWNSATYTLDVTDPTQARGATTLTFRFRCTLTQNGDTYMVDQTNPVNVRYLLTVTDPKGPVTWQRVA